MPRSQLYLISPPKFNLERFAQELYSALQEGDVAAFQLRMKDTEAHDIRQAAEVLKPICHGHSVQFIINDSALLAKDLQADGVHLGEDDGSVADARKILGKNAVIGASCYDSVDLAIKKAEEGADYVAFGAFFPTATKVPKATPEPEIIKWWVRNATVPCVAIGGITPQNCKILLDAGADFLAVISYVWQHPKGAAEAIREFSEVLG